jgi:hypothetical protein
MLGAEELKIQAIGAEESSNRINPSTLRRTASRRFLLRLA